MTTEIQRKRWSKGKIISVVLLVILWVWQCLIAYQVYGLSKLFVEFEPANYKVGFMNSMQPFIWVLIILTVGVTLDISKRAKFLILNSILIISIIIVANVSLSFFITMEGYEPIMNLDSK